MHLPRMTIRLVVAGLMLVPAGIFSSAQAQGQFDARYTLSVNSIPLGTFAWRAQIGAGDYSANALGRASGIFSMLLNGEGMVSVKGTVKDGRLQSASYVSAFTRGDTEKAGVQMLIDGGRVRDLKIEETNPDTDRIPVTDVHKQDIADPLTALLIPASPVDPVAGQACERKLSIFDGRRRFDLDMSFRRNDKAMPEKGYSGPALVCAVKFTPIAGHRASSPLLTFLIEGRDIEIWFVPVAGTRVLAPVRLSIASAIGTMLLRADQFEVSTGVASGRM